MQTKKYFKNIPEIALYAFLAYMSIFIIEGGWHFFIELFFDFEYKMVVINLAMVGTSVLIIWILRTYFYKSFVSFYHSVKDFKKSLPISMTVLAVVITSYLLISYVLYNTGTISISIHPNFWGTANSIVKSVLVFTAVAVGEEIVYRGFLFNTIYYKVKKRVNAMIISSVLFSIGHFHYDSIFDFIIAFWAGIILCILYVKYKSLYPAIFFHFAWNFSYIFFSFIQEISPYKNNPLIETKFLGVLKQYPEIIELYILITISVLLLIVHFIEKARRNLKKRNQEYGRPELIVKI